DAPRSRAERDMPRRLPRPMGLNRVAVRRQAASERPTRRSLAPGATSDRAIRSRVVTDRTFLLGAGASAEAGVPTSVPLTKAIVDRLNEGRSGPDQAVSALNFVCGVLIASEGAIGESTFEGLDVERVFAAVELLARRRDLEVSPFVSLWN